MKRSAQQNIFAPTFSLQDPMRYWTAKYFPPSCKVVIQRFVELLLVYISSINKHSFVIRWHFSPFSLRKVPSPFCIVIEKPEIKKEHPARIGSHDKWNQMKKGSLKIFCTWLNRRDLHQESNPKNEQFFLEKSFNEFFIIPIIMWNCENLFKPNRRARSPVSVVETLSS